MPMSDGELEAGLRNLRARADVLAPPPADLADRTRALHRAQRRSRAALAAGGLVTLAVVVGVPVAASGLLAGDRGSEVAVPSGPTRAAAPSLYDVPARGSLAGDEEWLAGVRQLDWTPPELTALLPPGVELPDPPVETRRVAWAGEVGGGRVALVLARTEQDGVLQAWFTGPGDAAPGEMALLGAPGPGPRLEPTALLAAPEPGSAERVLVVVGAPGDGARALTGRTVTASADVLDHWAAVPMEDGAGALALGATHDWATGMRLEMARPGQAQPLGYSLTTGDDLTRAWDQPVEVADPRGLLGSVHEEVLQQAARQLAGRYGLPLRELRPTLLAAGGVEGADRGRTLLVGLTFPSGATGAAVVDYWTDRFDQPQESSFAVTLAPAGTPLLEQVFAVPTSESIAVSGPGSGVLAEVYLSDGSLHATVPLVDGAGVGPLRAPAADRVRILDDRGAVVAEAPLSEADG